MNNVPGLKITLTLTHSSYALTSRAFIFPSQKHIFHTINFPERSVLCSLPRPLLLNPYLEAHVEHLRLVYDPEDEFFFQLDLDFHSSEDAIKSDAAGPSQSYVPLG